MSARHSRRIVGGFAIHTLADEALSLSIAPQLGGRVVSLRDRTSGREWLDGWAPPRRRRIWHPADPADFNTGPGAGIDECLPTVLPCRVGDLDFPDHGELWNRAPHFEADPEEGFFCRWKLETLPLTFERRITLEGNSVRLAYRIENLASTPTPFLWAWHPLFTWKPGDRIHFPTGGNSCVTPEGQRLPWPEIHPGCDLSRAEFPPETVQAAKVFLGPMAVGRAEIHAGNGARLILKWPVEWLPHAGVWITRGFWKGLHHWAIEPTNAPVDRLSQTTGGDAPSASLLGAGEIRNWSLDLGC